MLLALIVIPFVAGLLSLVAGRKARWISLCAALTDIVIFLLIAVGGSATERYAVLPEFGANLVLTLDGVSLALTGLTALIYATSTTTAWSESRTGTDTGIFYGLLNLLVAGVFGVFLSDDLLLFFLFYELAVLPMYLLIGRYGSSKAVAPDGPFAEDIVRFKVGDKRYGAMKLTLMLMAGSALIIWIFLDLYVYSGQVLGQGTFSWTALQPIADGDPRATWLFLGTWVGFGVLAGIWPLHTWSPDGHASAPPAASMMHAGVLMKLGAFGILKIGYGLFPEVAAQWTWLVGAIACINIVYGALAASGQTDMKYLVAYSSVSHMGIVMLGIATINELGWTGAVFQMVSHGIMTALFFTLVGIVYDKTHKRDLRSFGRLAEKAPALATIFIIASLTSIGLPGLSGFPAEFSVFVGALQHNTAWFLAAVTGAFLTAVYVLRAVRNMFYKNHLNKGEEEPEVEFHAVEWVTPVVLAGTLIVLGLIPGILLGPVGATVAGWLAR